MNYNELYLKAHTAGVAAGSNHRPVPMVVVEHTNLLDDSSPVKRAYPPVTGGVCGFAWINVKPGTSTFARWLKIEGIGKADSYYGGITIWVSLFGQSYEKKMAYAEAFVQVLVDAGIKASVHGRLD